MKKLAAWSCLIFFALPVHSQAKKAVNVALVYKGLGSCSILEGDAGHTEASECSEVSAVVARKAGFQVRFVKPDALSENATAAEVQALFRDAKVWIQPGGYSPENYNSMTNKLVRELKQFIASGGGYVGFCAGAFMALDLGFFPGAAYVYYPDYNAFGYAFPKIKWNGKDRHIFFQGGAYFTGVESDSSVEKIALYEDGLIAAARTHYGKGKVFLSGPHPEAPKIWSAEDGVKDPDGSDLDLAIEMVKWSSQGTALPQKSVSKKVSISSSKPKIIHPKQQ